jgi:hypothetical protein
MYSTYQGQQDLPWWYNERATISILAGAAWNYGFIAIEEYSTKKGKLHRSRQGRCDLYIGTGTQHFVCEAKQIWVSIGRRTSESRNKINKEFKDACDNARELDRFEGRRLGLGFIVPHLPLSDERYLNECLSDFKNEVLKIKCHAIAWAFPSKTRYLKGDDNRFYPGIVLLVKEVFRSA